MSRRPGTPRLLRQLNDRAALELLLSIGPLTRAELGERTGLSKVTAGQLLSRLEDQGLVGVVGEQAGGRGPNAALYGVVPSCAYVAGLEVLPDSVTAAVADITGKIVAEVMVDPTSHHDPVKIVHRSVQRACESANVTMSQLRSFVIGTRGVVDPRTGDVRFSFDLPAWHEGVLADLRASLHASVRIENDVNLAALAERSYGAAVAAEDFVLVWAGVGQGLGVMLGGRLHRGLTGGAGEIGWLPVPGEPLPVDVRAPQSGSFQRLVGGDAVAGLAEAHGLPIGPVEAQVRDAVAVGAGPFLDDLAARLAVGVAAVAVVLDPGLIVLSGDVGRAGGAALAARVEEAVARVCPSQPRVVVTEVTGNPVLRGAVMHAVEQAREELFDRTVGP
ncbi:Sugar kinase of the NBD/HSP70 family, may contain an N-terminal HTH domain [Sinosporangium album]|uniref:Sugar kinase of the NBD/HSP70 family, may contain an N-terminal HTH domain n=1 Tax=Sinosporangium album TaxID=504805 RepID=A0A1G7RYF6_9ACTN|nr:ROK family transcriptional regulator [Sinosporangium album]SDG15786.1 Sugar kinase of the NBD/HSP70 family, may contain an N-terminal HTH domain [Sinosporangium album]